MKVRHWAWSEEGGTGKTAVGNIKAGCAGVTAGGANCQGRKSCHRQDVRVVFTVLQWCWTTVEEERR